MSSMLFENSCENIDKANHKYIKHVYEIAGIRNSHKTVVREINLTMKL